MKIKLILTLFLLYPLLSFADIYNCNGVITNLPCDNAKVIAPEKKYQEPDQATIEQKKKNSLFDKLHLKAITAQNELDIKFDLSLTRESCKVVALNECLELLTKKERELTLLTEREKNRRAKDEKKVAIENSKVNSDNNNTAITIIDDRDTTYVKDGSIIRFRRPLDPYDRYGRNDRWGSSPPSNIPAVPPKNLDPNYDPRGYMPNNPSPYAPPTPNPSDYKKSLFGPN